MKRDAPLRRISEIQGPGLTSPLATKAVRLRGVVTGRTRKGYFVQEPERSEDPRCSDALFVYSPRRKPKTGSLVELLGIVVDFRRDESERPTTQLKPLKIRRLSKRGPEVEPVWLTAELLRGDGAHVASVLNGLEGMLVGIEAGSIFAAPSNPFGDYVCLPPGWEGQPGAHGGLVVDPEHPDRWLPGFRITRYGKAPKVNVGAKLLSPAVGPLNYRANSFQIALRGDVDVEPKTVRHQRLSWSAAPARTSILTLNGFNLDVQIEDPSAVNDPGRDVDDDEGYGRFELLAKAIVEQAGAPDIVALQEIQDNDGAELTPVVDASETYEQLIEDCQECGGPTYAWAEIPPKAGADGGQPGGNIRNAFLYNPERVSIVDGSLVRLGVDDEAFAGSRKPLLARFRVASSGAELVVVNVHLASKRHQHGLFAPERPGYDPREEVRVRQAELVRDAVTKACADGADYYITGDFNDFEFSNTLAALRGTDGTNMVDTLLPGERFDYNHRGQLQVLMHGIVPTRCYDEGLVDYEILHGNELIGVKPGTESGKASDHAYVIARLQVS